MVDATAGTGGAAGQPAVSGATVYANAGGNGEGAPDYTAGGGGGAGAAGSNSSGNAAGPGGAGQLFSNFTSYGESGYFGGGGGGAYNSAYATSAGTGGTGGGANGREVSAGNGYDATAHTGGGGGAGGQYVGWASPATSGGSGGSGTVIVYDGTTYTQFVSGSPHTITANGDVKNTRVSNHSFSAKGDSHIIGQKIGTGCGAFDGTGDYLSVADSADWTFGTGDFTLESWINITNTEQTVFSQYADASNRWYLTIDNRDAQQSIAFYHHGASCSIETSTGAWPGVHQWAHLAFVRASGVIKVYVDGVSQTLGTNTNPNADLTDIAAALRIGDYNGGNQFNGYLDEIRISNSARYTTNFTPDTTAFSSDANTKLLLHCDGAMGSTTFTDSSSGTHAVTATGDAMIVAPKIGTGMARFDGTGDYLSTDVTSVEPDWDFGTGPFTIEMYVNFRSIGGSNESLIANHAGGGNGWQWIYDTNHFELWATDQSEYTSSTISLAVNTWHHIAVTRDGDTLRHYANGTQVSTNAFTETMNSLGTPLVISSHNSSGAGSIDGFMDEIRISKTCRYPSGTTFTPSTTAFNDDKDTVLLMHMDGGGNIVGGVATDAGQGTYFRDASTNAIFYSAGVPTNKSLISFDGTGDYLSMPASPGWHITGDYTWECWVNPNKNPAVATAVHMQLMGQYLSATDRNQLFLSDNGGVYMWLADGGSSDWYGNTGYSFTPGEWYHVAASRASGTLRVFINGTELFNASSSLDTDFDAPFEIGRKGDNSLYTNGKMDQIRISDNARYTANFTAPTTPFTVDTNTKLLIQSDFSEGGLGADHSGNYNYFHTD